jgi:hypothetical protein
MPQPSLSPTARSQTSYADVPVRTDAAGNEAQASGVSWPAVTGGAFVTAALSLILLALGAGLGLSSVSPWSNTGASASTISTAAILWLIFVQIASGAMGGYLAGRLRTKWASLHTDEVYFRDTAHGFLSWAVAFVATAAFLTTAATFMVGAAASSATGAGAAAGVQATAQDTNASGYFVDALFRSNNAQPDPNVATARAEAGRILAYSAKGDVSAADRSYLAQLVAARTGVSGAEAERRVAEVITAAKDAADTARKATAHALLWTFLALLIGAFCASFSATIGGRQRDLVVVV